MCTQCYKKDKSGQNWVAIATVMPEEEMTDLMERLVSMQKINEEDVSVGDYFIHATAIFNWNKEINMKMRMIIAAVMVNCERSERTEMKSIMDGLSTRSESVEEKQAILWDAVKTYWFQCQEYLEEQCERYWISPAFGPPAAVTVLLPMSSSSHQ